MKKVLSGVVAITLIALLSGCGGTKEMQCTLESNDVVNGYQLKSTYNITYNGNIVEKVNTIEEVTSDDETTLDTLEEYFDSTYSTMNDTYGGYTFDITRSDNTITSNVTIDYSKVDLEQLVNDQPSMKSIINSKNQMTLEGIQSLYEDMGATCN